MVKEIMKLFPTAIVGTDIVFQDDGDGVYIKEWNLAGAQPTAEDILIVSTEALKDETVAHIKNLFVSKVNEVLTTHQYDSLATVKLWADDATFGAEASVILDWYKACIFYNINLENTMTTIPTDADYLAGLPVLVI